MECLIAIGIGIALIGIGTAVYFTVRDRAYQTMCASNLRQIYDAAKMYSLTTMASSCPITTVGGALALFLLTRFAGTILNG